jgi:hypothetical protein
MNGGSTRYCIAIACSHPTWMGGCGNPSTCQRASTSQSVQQSIANSTLVAPTKKSRRCGAAASNAGEPPAMRSNGQGLLTDCIMLSAPAAPQRESA